MPSSGFDFYCLNVNKMVIARITEINFSLLCDRNALWFPFDRKDQKTLFWAIVTIVAIIWKPGFRVH